jgi:hypothetical protein
MKDIITYILKKIVRSDNATALGRWNLDYCEKLIKNKVDFANVDHCGTCSQYKVKKTNKIIDLE